MSLVSIAENISAITPDRLENLVNAMKRTEGVDGDMAELGVYKGGSALVMNAAYPKRLLHLFDTFTGMPRDEDIELDPRRFVQKGLFSCHLDLVRIRLTGCNVEFHAGLFPATAKGLKARFSFVHIDCDLGSVAADAIKWFHPRLNNGGILYFDDYGCLFTGVTRAVDAAFPEHKIEKQHDMYGNQIGALVVV